MIQANPKSIIFRGNSIDGITYFVELFKSINLTIGETPGTMEPSKIVGRGSSSVDKLPRKVSPIILFSVQDYPPLGNTSRLIVDVHTQTPDSNLQVVRAGLLLVQQLSFDQLPFFQQFPFVQESPFKFSMIDFIIIPTSLHEQLVAVWDYSIEQMKIDQVFQVEVESQMTVAQTRKEDRRRELMAMSRDGIIHNHTQRELGIKFKVGWKTIYNDLRFLGLRTSVQENEE